MRRILHVGERLLLQRLEGVRVVAPQPFRMLWIVNNAPLAWPYSYIYAEFDDGLIVGEGALFHARDAGFTWEEYPVSQQGDQCIESHTTYDFCTPAGYDLGYYYLYTGNNQNFTVTIN